MGKAAKMDEEAMCLVSYASMIAGIVIAHAGTILLHIMGYPLTIYHNIHHGKANAILLPQFLEFMLVNSTVKEEVTEINSLFKPLEGQENISKILELVQDCHHMVLKIMNQCR